MDIHIFAVSSESGKIMSSCAPSTSTTEDTVTIGNYGFFPLILVSSVILVSSFVMW